MNMLSKLVSRRLKQISSSSDCNGAHFDLLLSFFLFSLQMCACASRSWGPPAGGNLWTVSGLLSCATRTASAVHVTGSCANACQAGTKSATLCWPLRSARGLWKCCRTHRCMTAAAREAWRRNCNACRTTGASTWAWLRVSLQHSEGCVNLIRPSAAC